MCYINESLFLFLMNGESAALKDAETLTNRFPGSRDWQSVMLSALESVQKYKEALSLLDKMSFSFPDELELLVERQLLLLAMGDSDALSKFKELTSKRYDLQNIQVQGRN